MNLLAPILRVATEIVGVFLILAATSDRFDASEIAALIGIAAVLVTVESVVAFLRVQRAQSRDGSSRVTVLALLAVFGLAFVRDTKPEFYVQSETAAAVAALDQA